MRVCVYVWAVTDGPDSEWGPYTASETESNSNTQVYATCTRSHLNVLLGHRNIRKIQSPCLLLEGGQRSLRLLAKKLNS